MIARSTAIGERTSLGSIRPLLCWTGFRPRSSS